MKGHRGAPPYPALVGVLLAVVVFLFVVSVAVGYARFDLVQATRDALAGRPTLGALLLTELRLPRGALGAMVGFSLGLSGAAMQGLMRNPLADPGIVGVSGSAALGAVTTFYFGLAAASQLALPLGGIAGAFAATLALVAMAAAGAGTMTLMLAGVAINSFAAALTSLALNLSPNPYAVSEIVFWLMGSFADRSLAQVGLVLPLMAVGCGVVAVSGPALDALALGEDTAASLGVPLARLRLQLVTGTALAVGSAVAVTGAIGFVGLVVPHLLRPLVAHRPGPLLAVSGLGGAALTLAADIAVRLVPVHPELKPGVVTAIIGAPLLLGLVYRLRFEP
jgi:iron complex transport system permease protein